LKVQVQFPVKPSREQKQPKKSEKRTRSSSLGEKRLTRPPKQLQGSLLSSMEKGVISTRTVSVKRKKATSSMTKGSLAQRAMLSNTTGEIETKKHENS